MSNNSWARYGAAVLVAGCAAWWAVSVSGTLGLVREHERDSDRRMHDIQNSLEYWSYRTHDMDPCQESVCRISVLCPPNASPTGCTQECKCSTGATAHWNPERQELVCTCPARPVKAKP